MLMEHRGVSLHKASTVARPALSEQSKDEVPAHGDQMENPLEDPMEKQVLFLGVIPKKRRSGVLVVPVAEPPVKTSL